MVLTGLQVKRARHFLNLLEKEKENAQELWNVSSVTHSQTKHQHYSHNCFSDKTTAEISCLCFYLALILKFSDSRPLGLLSKASKASEQTERHRKILQLKLLRARSCCLLLINWYKQNKTKTVSKYILQKNNPLKQMPRMFEHHPRPFDFQTMSTPNVSIWKIHSGLAISVYLFI